MPDGSTGQTIVEDVVVRRDAPAPGALLEAAAIDTTDADSGVRWIYRWIGALRSRHGLDEVVLVLDSRLLGRQVFRAGREPLRGGWATRVALQHQPGLYTQPAVAVAEHDEVLAMRLCSMAFELDVMRDRSLHDALTGLHNRRGFDEFIDQALEQQRRYGWPFSLVLLDLDDFKRINDRIGHAAGDEVLRSVGREIANALRQGDTAARVGGDEFALVLSGTEVDAVPALIDRLRNRLAADVPHAPVSFSTGAASCPGEGITREELFSLADRRLYIEKARP